MVEVVDKKMLQEFPDNRKKYESDCSEGKMQSDISIKVYFNVRRTGCEILC